MIRHSWWLANSNFGRRHGWFIEFDDRIIGELDDARHDDMFWYSYRVIFGSQDHALLNDISNWERSEFTFVNRQSNEKVNQVLVGDTLQFMLNGRVLLRGLSLLPRNKTELWMIDAFIFLRQIFPNR